MTKCLLKPFRGLGALKNSREQRNGNKEKAQGFGLASQLPRSGQPAAIHSRSSRRRQRVRPPSLLGLGILPAELRRHHDPTDTPARCAAIAAPTCSGSRPVCLVEPASWPLGVSLGVADMHKSRFRPLCTVTDPILYRYRPHFLGHYRAFCAMFAHPKSAGQENG